MEHQSNTPFELGKEPSFLHLIHADQRNPSILNRLRSLEPISVLDVGCGVPTSLCSLKHAFRVERAVGFESAPQREVLKAWGKGNGKDAEDYSAAVSHDLQIDRDEVRSYLKYKDVHVLGLDFREISDEEFEKHGWTDYNLIILSNSLHYGDASRANDILNRVKRLLRKDGVVYLHVKERPGNCIDFATVQRVIKVCNAFANPNDLKHYSELECASEGKHHTWTNL